jgi:hypothetical protein
VFDDSRSRRRYVIGFALLHLVALCYLWWEQISGAGDLAAIAPGGCVPPGPVRPYELAGFGQIYSRVLSSRVGFWAGLLAALSVLWVSVVAAGSRRPVRTCLVEGALSGALSFVVVGLLFPSGVFSRGISFASLGLGALLGLFFGLALGAALAPIARLLAHKTESPGSLATPGAFHWRGRRDSNPRPPT